MTVSLVPQIPKPTETNNLVRIKDKIFTELRVCTIGEIVEYNIENQTAEIKLLINAITQTYAGNTTTNLPNLQNVPIQMSHGINGGLILSIQPGDQVIVIFTDRSIDNWFIGKIDNPPNVALMHHYNSAIAIPYIHNEGSFLQEIDNESNTLSYQQTILRMKDKIQIYNEQQDFWENMNDLLTQLIDTTAQLSNTASQLADIANTLATAQTIPAAIGAPLTMDPGTIAQAQAVKAQATQIGSNVDTIKQNISTLQTNFGELFSVKT